MMRDSSKRSEKKARRHFSGAEKVAIVKAHLIDHVAISDLCEQHQIQPSQFHQWQKQLFEQGAAAFERAAKPGRKSAAELKLQRLREKLASKNEVISELMEENVRAKKEAGEL